MATDRTEQWRREPQPNPRRNDDEGECDDRDFGNARRRNGAFGDNARHDRQNDESENVVGNGGIGLATTVAFFAGAALIAPVIIVGVASDMVVVTVLGLVLLVLWVIAVSVISSALSGVFRTVLYRYAVAGTASNGFTAEDIAASFKTKPKRRVF